MGSQRLRALGWGDGHTKAFAVLQEAAGADLIPALVTEAGEGGCTAESGTGTIRATYGPNLLLSMARDPLRRPLNDDWIAVRCWPDGRCTAEAILSRRVTLMGQPPRS
jgi:ribosome biogenesis GTPase